MVEDDQNRCVLPCPARFDVYLERNDISQNFTKTVMVERLGEMGDEATRLSSLYGICRSWGALAIPTFVERLSGLGLCPGSAHPELGFGQISEYNSSPRKSRTHLLDFKGKPLKTWAGKL